MARDKFILMCLFIVTTMHALNAGLNFHYDFYMDEGLEVLYAYTVMFFMLFYVRSIGFKIAGSFDHTWFFSLLYPVIVPYALIKQKKIVKGIAFTMGWLCIINVSYVSAWAVYFCYWLGE